MCARDGIFFIEVDRVLKPGGYFVWTSPLTNVQSFLRNKEKQKRWNFVRDFAENLCWELLSQQDETVLWKKTSKRNCYNSRKPGSGPPICSKGQDIESSYYRPLQNCIGGTHSRRWLPIEERPTWPSRSNLNKNELVLYGIHSEELNEDTANYKTAVRNYWSLLSPLIFSDHPKRPGKSVWVMNVVSTSGPNNLSLILDRGYVGVLHDWCEAFPTYPRTYDMVHAEGLISLESSQHGRCTMLFIFTEINRLLHPEGWVIIRDTANNTVEVGCQSLDIPYVLNRKKKEKVNLDETNDDDNSYGAIVKDDLQNKQVLMAVQFLFPPKIGRRMLVWFVLKLIVRNLFIRRDSGSNTMSMKRLRGTFMQWYRDSQQQSPSLSGQSSNECCNLRVLDRRFLTSNVREGDDRWAT
ncbi:putative pectin methyltransferase QUA2 [Hibiscus syriacus]|uniref:Methyltransferase n=1 Tax=Hibiscus syriacus TaxID=106335 RepID=A0A6A3CG66_HIBSY|nr:putative pectin methyltransferase QUA2 [Hibiscus syriacus]